MEETGCCEHLLVGTSHSADRVGTETREDSQEMIAEEQGEVSPSRLLKVSVALILQRRL